MRVCVVFDSHGSPVLGPVRRLALLALALGACAGCGSGGSAAPPRLPRALAHAWAERADAIARAVEAGNACRAQRLATALGADVVAAVNAHRVPRPLLEPLVSAVNDLAARTTCPAASGAAPPSGGGHG